MVNHSTNCVKKNLAIEDIRKVIVEAPRGSTLKEISASLGVTHQAILYRFKQYPDLKQLFDSIHSTESIVSEAIREARKNATASEIARKLGMTRQCFNKCLQYHPKLRALYESLHCNTEKKITESTLEKITRAIIDAPKGTPINKLKEYGVSNAFIYFKDFPELRELYTRIHGQPKRRKSRNFDTYIKIADAIKNAPLGSYISDIANSMDMDSGLFRFYMKNAPCLKLLYYNAIHGKPTPKAKGIPQGKIYETIERMENPTISKIARQLNIDKSSISKRFKKYPMLKQFYEMKRK